MLGNICLIVRIHTECIKVILETPTMLTTTCYLMGKRSNTRNRLKLTSLTLKHQITILVPKQLSQVNIIYQIQLGYNAGSVMSQVTPLARNTATLYFTQGYMNLNSQMDELTKMRFSLSFRISLTRLITIDGIPEFQKRWQLSVVIHIWLSRKQSKDIHILTEFSSRQLL